MSPEVADTVAKVENRTTLKISRKLIFRPLCCCLAIQHRYEGPWSILDESIWSLTSPRVKRISGSKKFRSSPQKDFFNTICQQRTHAPQQIASLFHHLELRTGGPLNIRHRPAERLVVARKCQIDNGLSTNDI